MRLVSFSSYSFLYDTLTGNSPVKIELAGNYTNDSVQLTIENRMLFQTSVNAKYPGLTGHEEFKFKEKLLDDIQPK